MRLPCTTADVRLHNRCCANVAQLLCGCRSGVVRLFYILFLACGIYTSSQTTISVPLYTTMILCSFVVLMEDVTTSLSAYLFT